MKKSWGYTNVDALRVELIPHAAESGIYTQRLAELAQVLYSAYCQLDATDPKASPSLTRCLPLHDDRKPIPA